MTNGTGPSASWKMCYSVFSSGDEHSRGSPGQSCTRSLCASSSSGQGQTPKKRFKSNGESFCPYTMQCLINPIRVIYETHSLNILRDAVRFGGERSVQDLAERELQLDKTLIQLIRWACQSHNQGRALDFARQLHHLPSLENAVKVAQASGLITLQKAMERLKIERGGGQKTKPSTTRAPSRTIAQASQMRPTDVNDHIPRGHETLSISAPCGKRKQTADSNDSQRALPGEYTHYFQLCSALLSIAYVHRR